MMRSTDGASVRDRVGFYLSYHRRIADAQHILIVGGGPIGVEVAGEIIEHYPHKTITILEGHSRILASTSAAASEHAAHVLKASGVTILTGERLERTANIVSEVLTGSGEAVTNLGRKIPYDLVMWCTGGKPNTGYMKTHFSTSLDQIERIRVTPELRVVGSNATFALGDITDLDENKMAWHIGGQVKVAAHNIRSILKGPSSHSGFKVYRPKTGNPMMAVTLGSRNGVLHLPVVGVVRSSCLSRLAKAEHMLVPQYRKALGLKD